MAWRGEARRGMAGGVRRPRGRRAHIERSPRSPGDRQTNAELFSARLGRVQGRRLALAVLSHAGCLAGARQDVPCCACTTRPAGSAGESSGVSLGCGGVKDRRSEPWRPDAADTTGLQHGPLAVRGADSLRRRRPVEAAGHPFGDHALFAHQPGAHQPGRCGDRRLMGTLVGEVPPGLVRRARVRPVRLGVLTFRHATTLLPGWAVPAPHSLHGSRRTARYY